MFDFSKLKVIDEVENTAYKKYFWVSDDVVISPVFDGFNAACRFKYKGKYACESEDNLCCLYMIPSLYSNYCQQILL